MQPRDLLDSAKLLVNSRKGKPSQVNLRRAISAAYYALFHKLARTCADLLIGGQNSIRSKPAWRQTYRALEHGLASQNCGKKDRLRSFPKPIEDFGNTFSMLQKIRHEADYDPYAKFTKSQTLSYIAMAEQSISDFESSNISDKRAFCAFVLFKPRAN